MLGILTPNAWHPKLVPVGGCLPSRQTWPASARKSGLASGFPAGVASLSRGGAAPVPVARVLRRPCQPEGGATQGAGAADVARRDLRDGQLPAYLFTSPCCGARTLLAAWIIEYARRRTEGRLLIQCGRHGSDTLRAAGAVPAFGCGRHYVVHLETVGHG